MADIPAGTPSRALSDVPARAATVPATGWSCRGGHTARHADCDPCETELQRRLRFYRALPICRAHPAGSHQRCAGCAARRVASELFIGQSAAVRQSLLDDTTDELALDTGVQLVIDVED